MFAHEDCRPGVPFVTHVCDRTHPFATEEGGFSLAGCRRAEYRKQHAPDENLGACVNLHQAGRTQDGGEEQSDEEEESDRQGREASSPALPDARSAFNESSDGRGAEQRAHNAGQAVHTESEHVTLKCLRHKQTFDAWAP